MGQHHQEESEGRQGEEGGDLVITVLHNVPNDIAGMFELRKLTDVGESFCELEVYILIS